MPAVPTFDSSLTSTRSMDLLSPADWEGAAPLTDGRSLLASRAFWLGGLLSALAWTGLAALLLMR